MTDKLTKIWSEFTKVRDGKELKFRIEELPKEKHMDLFEFYFDHFVPEETMHKGAGIPKATESLTEYKQLILRSSEEQQYQMDACYLVGDGGSLTMVGGSLLIMERSGDPDVDWDQLIQLMQTEETKKFLTVVKLMASVCDVRKKYNLDTYFDDRGITVHRDYRRLGIAGELFKARVPICRHYNVPMTGAWMTSIGTQKAAAKLDWETIYELSYDDVSKAVNINFEGTPPTCKLMVIRA